MTRKQKEKKKKKRKLKLICFVLQEVKFTLVWLIKNDPFK